MKARRIMTTDVVTIGADATVREAIELMLTTGHHALPVLSSEGKLAGLVTQVEILHLCLPEYAERIGDLAFLPDDFEPFDHRMEEVGEVQVGSVMLTEVVTVTQDTAIVELAALMVLREARTLPVVQGGEVVGVVGRQDLVAEIVQPHAK